MSSFLHERALIHLLRGSAVSPTERDDLDPADWVDLVKRHRLAGVVSRLVASDPLPWPPALVEGLQAARRKTLADNMVLLEALHAGGSILAELGVPFVVLKGASLLGRLYADPDLRPMTDIDLLIRQEDWPRLAAVLRERGYSMPSAEQESYYGARWYHQLVESPGFPSCWIEFHWNIESSERSRVDPAGLMARAESYVLDGRSYHRLADVDLLLHLGLHLAHHHDQPSLHWVEDIDRLLRATTFDWEAVDARATAWKVRNGLTYALAWVDHIRPGVLPDGARRFGLSPARRAILRRLGSNDPTLLHRPLRDSPARHALSMALLDRWLDAARYVVVHAAQRLGRRLGLARRAPGDTASP